MSIYDEIKSPLDNNETLKKILDIYVNGRVSGGSKLIENGEELYKRLIDYDYEQEDSQDNYADKFYQYIKLPNLNKLYKNISKMDFKVFDSQVENIRKKIESQPISEMEKKERISELYFKTIYPLSRFKFLFKFFENYSDIDKVYYEQGLVYIQNILDNIELYPSLEQENMKKLQELNLTEQQIEMRRRLIEFRRKMNHKFFGGDGVMGFHVNPQNLHIYDIDRKRENDELKFYINAGIDTYKFASLFQERCESLDINYYFKVVNADKYEEYKRNDRMCIYTEFKDADTFLSIIKELKEQNPDIKFQKPPLLAGTIDNFIGVGTDHITKGGRSYNVQMSNICFASITKIFEKVPREKIFETIKIYPEMIDKLKNEIKYRAKNIGLSEDKICIKEGIEQKLGQNQNESNFKNQSQQLRRGIILDLEEITTEELELF